MNWKKALAAGTLAVAAVTMIAGCGGNTDKQAAQKLPDKIVIGLDDNFPPMGFRDDSGQLVGFDIDLAQEASKRLGIPVEFEAHRLGQQGSGPQEQTSRHALERLDHHGRTVSADCLFQAVYE